MFASYLLAISLTAVSGMALTMNYPSTLVQCQAAQFNWSNGPPPYTLMATYNNSNNLRVLRQLAAVGEKTSYNWTVDFVTGTSLRSTSRIPSVTLIQHPFSLSSPDLARIA